MGTASQGSAPVFPNRLRAWVALGLLGANLFVIALSVYSLHQSRQQHELRAQVQTQNLAAAIDQNLSNSIDKIDLALRAIADHLEHELAEGGADTRATSALLSRYQQRLPEVEAIRVANADGLVILGKGLDPQERVNWADRDYFITLRDHADAGLQISKPRMGRVAKKYIVGFARRYNHPDGRFAGVISAPVSLDYFSALLSRFEVGRKGTVVLRDADLGLIARYPALSEGPAGVIGNTIVSRELSELARLGVGSATYHTRLSADGMERIVTFHRLHGAPMIAIVGAAKDDYLAEWYTEAYRTAAWIVGFALLSALSAGLLLRLLNRIMRESFRNWLFLHHASDGIHILDEKGNLVQASDQFCAMLGYGDDEMIGMNVSCWDVGRPSAELLGEILPARLLDENATTLESVHCRKNGELFDVQLNVVGFELDGKRYLFASSRDISDSKQQQRALAESEARLRQSEERYRLLLNNSPVGIVHFDRDLVITYANARFGEIMQAPSDYTLGLDCKKLKDQRVVPAMRQALAGEHGHYEGPYVTSFGHFELWIAMDCAPVLNEQGHILGGIVILEDTSARKRSEEGEKRQRESLVRLNEISASSHLPLDEQLSLALATGAEHLGLEFGIVSHIAGETYQVVSQVSPADTLHDGQIFPFGTTYCQITIEQSAVVAISEMGRSPYLGHPCYQAFQLEAYIGAPFYVGGALYGTVNFSSPKPYHRPFDGGDKEFVSLLARWVGSTIERDQARQRLAASEARLQAIIENEPECVKVVRPNGTLAQINRAGLEMLEVESIEQINAAGLLEFVVPEHRQAFAELSRRVFRGESGQVEFMIEGKKGTRRWLDTHAAPLRDETGAVVSLLGVTRDISARKQAESELRLAASVFSHAHEGILICDANQVILDVNPTFSEITGYSREEIIGQTPKFLASGRQDSEFYQGMWQAIASEGYWEGEIWNRRKNGGIYPERLSVSSVHDDNDRITHYIGTFSDISVLKRHQAQLEHLAHYDPLTQLPNRALLSDRMGQALAQAKRAGTQVAICYLDLDGFKPINDEFGHDAGDSLLIEVARRLRETMRAGDTVARLGGDEFVLLFLGIGSVDEAERAAVRVQRALTAPITVRGEQRCISGSLGITLFPADDCDPDTLLRHADQAMYQAKQAGRNCYRLFDPGQDHQAQGHREMLDRMRQAITGGEFVLHYQPIVDMRRGTVVAFEGLLRWQHPERGLLLPADFLPGIEGSAVDPELGRWVLGEGLRQLAAWRAKGLPQTLSLNVSASHLLAPDFVEELKTFLAAHPDLEAHALQIEIMETAAIKDLEKAIEVFTRCREAGVDIALDDFGTGYSSLSYFRRLPVDTLKIDQVFVQSILGSDEDLAVVESVVSLTKAFKRKLVAEGVESVEIGMLMLALGCHVGQGYGIARPMPADAIPAWTAGFVPDRNWSYPLTAFSREDMPLLLAELEHRAWVRRLGEWLDADGDQLSPPPLDSHHCRFGQWHDGRGQARYGQFPAFAEIGEIHEGVHGIAREIAQLYADGRLEEAHRRYADLLAVSERLLEQLAALQAEIVIEKMQLQTT